MEIKYLYNEKGEKTDVMIPIKEWNNIKGKLNTNKSPFDPSDYRGILKYSKEEIDKITSQMREEWD